MGSRCKGPGVAVCWGVPGQQGGSMATAEKTRPRMEMGSGDMGARRHERCKGALCLMLVVNLLRAGAAKEQPHLELTLKTKQAAVLRPGVGVRGGAGPPGWGESGQPDRMEAGSV